MYNIASFKKSIEDTASIINTSGLREVNDEFFRVLSGLIRDLNLKIISYENKLGTISPDELANDKATIAALFEFYMKEGGAKEIANNQIKTIKENLESIATKANDSNYNEVATEFEDTLKMYHGILKTASNSNIITALVAKFRYQIFKYKLKVKMLDDRININSIISFIIEDIATILEDNQVSLELKEELRKYALDVNLIREHFQEILILITLGLTKKSVTKKDISDALTSTYFYESEFQKEYHEPSDEIKKDTKDYTSLTYVYQSWKHNVKEYVAALLLCVESKKWRFPEDEIKNLVAQGFQDVKYLAEALIVNEHYEALIYYRNIFISIDKLYAKDFDLAVMAYRESIKPDFLADYSVNHATYGQEFLINYMFSSGKNSYLDTNFENLPSKYQIGFLEYELSSHEADEEKILLEYFKEAKYIAQKSFFERFIASKSFSYIRNILNSIIDYFPGWKPTFLLLLNLITDPIIKKEILDYYYEATKNINNPENKLLSNEVGHKMRCPSYNIADKINSLNIFEAYHLSSIVEKENILPLVKKFYTNKLDWHHILEESAKLEDEEFFTVVMYCYLGNKAYFIEHCELSHKGLREFLLEKIPESIIDLMCTLGPIAVANLDSKLLDIFANNYEQQMANAGLNTNDIFSTMYSKDPFDAETIEFFIYVMYRGLLTPEIMNYYKKYLFYSDGQFSKSSNTSNLMAKAIINSKQNYNRPSFVATGLKGYPYCGFSKQEKHIAAKNNCVSTDFDFNIIFLTEKELNEIKNDNNISLEVRILRIRKYYGDLLKLIGLVPKNIENRIVFEITKSGILEYLLYIKANYPEYMTSILANISNPELYHQLIDFNGAYNIDDALRIAEINAGKPRS
ncbi:MAG: hypothetical protein OSJ63_03040 [Bacilli bacterium]|nr:hypothetical protein [Bacilli bacterium]